MKIRPAQMQQKNIKKPVKINKKRMFFIFSCAFIGFFFLCTMIASMLSPKIDVPALNEENNLTSVSSDDFKGRIDPRLRMIEMENDIPRPDKNKTANNEEEISSYETDTSNINADQDVYQDTSGTSKPRKEVMPYDSREYDESITPEDTTTYQDQEYEHQPAPVPPQPKKTPPKPATQKDNSDPLILRDKLKVQNDTKTLTKVFVGNYSDLNEAKRVSQELTYSDLNVTPFIKESNGKYSLQVGTFSNPQKAVNLANDLKKMNLATRLVQN